MIINFMVQVLTDFLQLVLSVLPTAPATPQAIIDGGDWIIDQIAGVISVLSMVYTQTLLTAIMVVVVAMFTWPYIYHGVMWIVRKIPILNIK